MQLNDRQQKILALLADQGEVSIQTFAKLLGVSEMTIHRDLACMEADGLLLKKRGAAVYVDCDDRPRADGYAKEKMAIAREAVKLIRDGDMLLFDNSTSALEVAKLVKGFSSLTVYATNLDVANELRNAPNVLLYCSGGFYLPASTGFVGAITEEFVSRVHATKCIVGTSGISPDYGLTCPYPMHANLQRLIIEASQTKIVVADHTKFGKVAIERVADIGEVDYLITDDKADEKMLARMGDKAKIIIAQV